MGKMCEWLNDLTGEWVSEWVNEWNIDLVSEWLSVRMDYCKSLNNRANDQMSWWM